MDHNVRPGKATGGRLLPASVQGHTPRLRRRGRGNPQMDEAAEQREKEEREKGMEAFEAELASVFSSGGGLWLRSQIREAEMLAIVQLLRSSLGVAARNPDRSGLTAGFCRGTVDDTLLDADVEKFFTSDADGATDPDCVSYEMLKAVKLT
uniref:Uncharacterized protein n=1 Tax=Chromera velia CCMP2878 TaxID=1169474 RepID=A0A0G4HXN3_9ALVE|eukprot:Cvel_9303.t1-p1 / transcript=Cvel_9303.t1 / gene=Cvel_9303 / organism=Chromera_velia_CCMP2878 / gene_product=hypothetical protein / transcript_product=hypothetical protein / location=Cvel_scaffold533:15176-16277(-) / protein_length=150 / sequence_SO=supercontig / SO=protein_coding / is_pseudo=false